MPLMWMVVADEAEARIYAVRRDGAPAVVEILEHPEGRMDVRDFKSDVPGTGRSDHSSRAYGLGGRTTPADTERDRFAAAIAHRLEGAVVSAHVHELALVMAPKLLGLVRSHLGDQARRAVVSEVHHRRVDAQPMEILREVERERPTHLPR